MKLEETFLLPAGPILDQQICEKVFRWKYAGFVKRGPVYETGYDPVDLHQVECGVDFCPSMNINDAWKLAIFLGCCMTVHIEICSEGSRVGLSGVPVAFSKYLEENNGTIWRNCDQEDIPFTLCILALQTQQEL
jgi:hypothetical protein